MAELARRETSSHASADALSGFLEVRVEAIFLIGSLDLDVLFHQRRDALIVAGRRRRGASSGSAGQQR